MGAVILNGLAFLCALDAAFVALLATGRSCSDPAALRTATALAVSILACGAVCLIVARVA